MQPRRVSHSPAPTRKENATVARFNVRTTRTDGVVGYQVWDALASETAGSYSRESIAAMAQRRLENEWRQRLAYAQRAGTVSA
jgi:hypothetical protein